MGLFTLIVRDGTRTVFQFSKTLAKVILVRCHKILCIETHLGDFVAQVATQEGGELGLLRN